METQLHVAMRAFIIHNKKVLIIRESTNYDSPNQGKYDVPGGKLHPGEKFDTGLLREIQEETGLNVTLGKPFSVAEWRPIIGKIQHHIVGTFFECVANSDKVTLSKDHDDYLWIDARDYTKFDIIETLKPAFEDYINR